MGALIFLLLVITQKIQKQALLPVASIDLMDAAPADVASELDAIPDQQLPVFSSDSPATADDPPLLPLLAESAPEPKAEESPLLPPVVKETRAEQQRLLAEWEHEQTLRKQAHAAELRKQQQAQQQLEQEWQTRLAQQTAELTQLEQRLSQLKGSESLLEAEIEKLRARSQATTDSEQQLVDKLQSAQQKKGRLQAEQARLANRMTELSRQIARLEADLSQRGKATEIVAYDSLTGTARKPILIECRERELVFASEGIVLTARDLSGFPPEYNPLKAGAEALLEHWIKSGEASEKPYILLVVRPEGTTGFYIARGLLSKLDHHFGYELVDSETQIHWPTTSPAAIEACQRAVQTVLSERQRVAAKVGRLAAADGPLNYSNQQGEFYLPEMDNLSRSGRATYLGDQKWVPPQRRNVVERQPLDQRSEPATTPQPGTRQQPSLTPGSADPANWRANAPTNAIPSTPPPPTGTDSQNVITQPTLPQFSDLNLTPSRPPLVADSGFGGTENHYSETGDRLPNSPLKSDSPGDSLPLPALSENSGMSSSERSAAGPRGESADRLFDNPDSPSAADQPRVFRFDQTGNGRSNSSTDRSASDLSSAATTSAPRAHMQEFQRSGRADGSSLNGNNAPDNADSLLQRPSEDFRTEWNRLTESANTSSTGQTGSPATSPSSGGSSSSGAAPPGNALPLILAEQNPFETVDQNTATGNRPGGSDPARRAAASRGGVIGIEREVVLHLWPDQFRVDDGFALSLPEAAAPDDIKRAFTAAISGSTSTWQEPPQSYFWKPVLKVVVHPGGIAHYGKARELADRWEVPTRIEHEIE